MITVMFINGCSPKRKPSIQKLEGINGSATYVFNAEGKVLFVQKDSFNVPNEWAVLLAKDTIKLGETFEGLANSSDHDFSLIVTEPSADTLTPSDVVNSVEYHYAPSTIGVYNFKGTINTGKQLAPFNYRFIVVQ